MTVPVKPRSLSVAVMMVVIKRFDRVRLRAEGQYLMPVIRRWLELTAAQVASLCRVNLISVLGGYESKCILVGAYGTPRMCKGDLGY